MADINDITGDRLSTKVASQEYLNNYDLIFRKPKTVVESQPESQKEESHEKSED